MYTSWTVDKLVKELGDRGMRMDYEKKQCLKDRLIKDDRGQFEDEEVKRIGSKKAYWYRKKADLVAMMQMRGLPIEFDTKGKKT